MPDRTHKPNFPPPLAIDTPLVEPEAFLATLLAISPEAAAEVREQADEKADPRE